ncbi:MAG: PDZ domain-containing protein [Actinobacteria bacterium]|nr:MAG: PDZ domain-containing protein [Actinomycetota bacterium]
MRSPRRSPVADGRSLGLLALALALVLVLVAGIWLGGHPENLPAFARDALVPDHETRVVDEAIDRIARDYYRPISKRRLAGSSIVGAVASLNDRFSHYLTPSEFQTFNRPPSFAGIGVAVGPSRRGLAIARVFDSSPAARARLRAGDVIVTVNGRSLAGISENAATALIKGPPGTDVVLGIVSPGHGQRAARSVRLTRATISEPVVASVMRSVRGVKLGVVGLGTFSPGAHGEVRKSVEHLLHSGARGIVLDLRANGGGLVEEARLVASIFIPRGTIVTTRGRAQPRQTLTAAGDAISTSIPVVVLVDANTASASEIVAAALQDHRRATIIGTHTFGKGVFQEEEPLANGGALDITVGEYFTPSGRNLGGGGVKQGAGVIPDAIVANGVDTRHGLDVALDALAAKAK